MPEYIERDSVLNIIKGNWSFMNSADDAIQTSIEMIRRLPAADVRPVTHERWKAFDFHTMACSGCGFKVDIMAVPSYVLHHLYHCPNCGADMRQEDGEGNV